MKFYFVITTYSFLCWIIYVNCKTYTLLPSPSENCDSSRSSLEMSPQISLETNSPTSFVFRSSRPDEIDLDTSISELTFVCKASYPIQWVFYNLPRITDNRRSWTIISRRYAKSCLDDNEIFTFEEKLNFQFRPPAIVPKISCKSLDSSSPLHSTVTPDYYYTTKRVGLKLVLTHCDLPEKILGMRYGSNPNCHVRLIYDEKSNKIYCSTNFTSLIKRGCSDYASCNGFFDPESPCNHTATSSEISDSEVSLNVDKDLGKYGSSGVVVCRESDTDKNSASLHYYTSLLKQCPESKGKEDFTTTYIYDISKSNGSDMLEMCDPSSNPVYVGEIIKVQCYGSFYYFSYGTLWYLGDGEPVMKLNVTPTEDEIPTAYKPERKYIKSVKSYQINLRILSEYINFTKLYCFAPVTNSAEWISKSKSITIKEPTPIQFKGPIIENITMFDKPFLNCSITGEPSPVLSWDFSSFGDLNFSTSGGGIWIGITLPDEAFYYGKTIRCIANRSDRIKGDILVKEYRLIKPSKIPTALIIATTSLTVLVIFIIIVMRKLRKIHAYPIFTIEERQKFKDMLRDYHKWAIPCKALKKGKLLLTNGSFSQIYEVTVFGKYAIKKSAPPFSPKIVLQMYLQEIERLCQITSKGDHENIIGFVGYTSKHISQGKAHIITEYCENMDLLSYLRKINDRFDKGPICITVGTSTISNHQQIECKFYFRHNLQQQLIKWAYQIAEGMKFLHSYNFLHGDLAARNIFVTKDLVCKIGDFGLSCGLKDYESYLNGKREMPIPWRWLPIESIGAPYQTSKQSDAYSYAVLLYELFSLGETPWKELDDNTPCLKIIHVVNLQNGKYLEKPDLAPVDIYENIMVPCWSFLKIERPSFTGIVDYFKAMHPESATSLNSTGESWLIQGMDQN